MISLLNKGVRIPADYLLAAILTYIYVGIFIFLFGWCAWYVSLPCTAVLLYIVYMMYNNYKCNEMLEIRLSVFIGIVIMGVVLYTIGWGRFTNQYSDWQKHNAVMGDLVNHDWPVVYEGENGERAMLTYYLAQYLFPCLIGKIFGSYRVAEVMNAVWAYWGMILIYLNLLRILRIKTPLHNFMTLFLLLFFSCPTEIGQKILYYIIKVKNVDAEWFYYDDSIKLQYSGNIVLLGWVYAQVIVNWMILTLFLENYRKINFYVPLLLPALIYGSFSFIGLIPYAIVWVTYQLIISRNRISLLKDVFSLYNILTTLSLGTVIVLYLLGNVLAEKPSEVSFKMNDFSDHWIVYFTFILIIVMVYMLLLFKENKRNWLYYTTLVSLLLYPLFTMGIYNDFTMRSSIPALFILMALTIKLLYNFKKAIVRSVIMLLLVLYSSRIYVIQTLIILKEDKITELAEDNSFGTLGQFIYRDNPDIEVALKYNYFTYDLEESLFYNYLAK